MEKKLVHASVSVYVSPIEERPVLDQNRIAVLRNLSYHYSPSLLSELIQMFLTQGTCLINEIKQDAQHGDTEKLRKAAHKLRGSALHLGAEQMAEICKDIESEAKSCRQLRVDLLIRQLERSFQATSGMFGKLVVC